MDLEEWELLSDDGFLEIHDDGGKTIFSRKYVSQDQNNTFEMDYFTCPSSPKPSSQLIHRLPVQLEPPIENIPDHDSTKEVNKPDDPDPITQVFFKKLKENEFVDMKMDSPKANSNQENDKEIVMNKKNKMKDDDEESWEENPGGLNMWKWSLNGIGAICSFGVAAATVCIIVFGGKMKNKHHQQEPQKLQFHIFTDDKRMNQVVHRASRLNEAMSAAVRGVPITRAHITFGGYYDGF